MPALLATPAPVVIRGFEKRGGIAAGEATNNPSDTTYAAGPPSSTYRGPTIAGSKGGFIGVVVGGFICLLIIGAGGWWFMKRRKAKSGRGRGVVGGDGRGRKWGRMEDDGVGEGGKGVYGDAFEMGAEGGSTATLHNPFSASSTSFRRASPDPRGRAEHLPAWHEHHAGASDVSLVDGKGGIGLGEGQDRYDRATSPLPRA